MQRRLFYLSVPGLRPRDIERLPRLAALAQTGTQTRLSTSFPAVTWPAQTAVLTGQMPAEHGVVANGFYWRERQQVEMWTAWNEVIAAPQLWDILAASHADFTAAVWFPMLSKGCGAQYVCMPAPIHNPDGSESLWCYTKPTELYGTLRDALGHFPLQHFWGPLANIRSTAWIVDSALLANEQFQPDFFYLYLPHLDYAAQKHGPDSPAAVAALAEFDEVVGKLIDGVTAGPRGAEVTWLIASEYAIVPVDHVVYPNRLLRHAGLLSVAAENGGSGEQLDFAASSAWALVDHQFSHVFVRDRDPGVIEQVSALFTGQEGIAEVLAGDQRAKYGLQHARSGDIVLVSTPNSWQAYYWWLDDAHAPSYARSVDIHRKPGYDPVELHVDMATKSIPLDANLVRGSHGAPVTTPAQEGVCVASRKLAGLNGPMNGPLVDRDLHDVVLRYFAE